MRNNIRPSQLVVGQLVAEPGTRVEDLRSAAVDGTAGSSCRLGTLEVPGKTLYIQAISDGDELNGIAVIHKVLQR